MVKTTTTTIKSERLTTTTTIALVLWKMPVALNMRKWVRQRLCYEERRNEMCKSTYICLSFVYVFCNLYVYKICKDFLLKVKTLKKVCNVKCRKLSLIFYRPSTWQHLKLNVAKISSIFLQWFVNIQVIQNLFVKFESKKFTKEKVQSKWFILDWTMLQICFRKMLWVENSFGLVCCFDFYV